MGKVFGEALKQDATLEGGLRLVRDLPFKPVSKDGCPCGEKLFIKRETLFRSGLHDEEFGPIVSQFFLRPIPYGTQTIDQRQVPYIQGKDFLTNRDDWLRAQNTGKDKFGRDYGVCNFYGDQLAGRETYYPFVGDKPLTRYISTIRDLARFVNRDALHQAYFNAALFLDAIDAPVDPGNPYRGNLYTREGGFATLGGPDLLTLVSEVASRALKVVWRQKWLVHRRCRPEVYGGLLEMQFNGSNRPYALSDWAVKTEAAKRVLKHNAKQNGTKTGTYFLPMAFSAGSPNHPAYGAGHATVAGACVTVLKAWFDEDAQLQAILQRAMMDTRRKEPVGPEGLLQPGARVNGEDFFAPQPYCGGDAERITVGGELNKIASNVAMGRSMGGVHWRSDNTRSLRLGEAIAIEILRKRTLEYAERPVSFTFRAFDRHMVRIANGQVQID
ncbi:MAG: vanadium-dependent haloperoxidase [Xanthomonadaceae bacterium]|nr:vanadium-dependent haloperoxidase [Xanthomonadaceae bacterium]